MVNNGNGYIVTDCKFKTEGMCALPGHDDVTCYYDKETKWRCAAFSFYNEHGHINYAEEEPIGSRFEILDI